MKITSVGVGTTSVGPISGGGAINLVGVERGALGSTAATHSDSDAVRKFTGSFNIVDSKIFFTDAPKGTNNVARNQSNLEFPRSEFNGRVYLRNDYSNNRIFDDISDGFTGIGATHRMTVSGVNTSGIQTGSTNDIRFYGNSTFAGTIDNVSVKQVNGNAGIMTNMATADIEEDTP